MYQNLTSYVTHEVTQLSRTWVQEPIQKRAPSSPQVLGSPVPDPEPPATAVQ